MTTTPSTQGRKVVLYDRATGQRFARWPVDAREMLATGAYQVEPVDLPMDAPLVDDALTAAIGVPAGIDTPDPVPHVTEAHALVAAQSPTGAPLVIGEAVDVTVGVPAPARAQTTPVRRRR